MWDSEAALGGLVGAVEPHDGYPSLSPLPALLGLLHHHGHCLLEHLSRCPRASPSLELLLPLETGQALMPVQIPAPSPGSHLVFNPGLLCSFRPGLDRPLRSPEVTSLPLHAIGSPQPALELYLAPQESSSWTSFVESSPVNPFAGGKKGDSLTFFFFLKVYF